MAINRSRITMEFPSAPIAKIGNANAPDPDRDLRLLGFRFRFRFIDKILDIITPVIILIFQIIVFSRGGGFSI